MKKNLLKSILALVAINMFSLANAQFLRTTLPNYSNVSCFSAPSINFSNINASVGQNFNQAVFHIIRPLSPLVASDCKNYYQSNYTQLLYLTKELGSSFPRSTITSKPSWGLDIKNEKNDLVFSYVDFNNQPTAFPICALCPIGVTWPKPTDIYIIGQNQVTSFVPFKVNNISSIAGSLNLNSNVEVNGEFRVVNTNGGSNSTEFKIDNAGFVRAREIKVDVDVIPDYVFKEGYKLMSLDDLEKFIQKEKHLPNIKGENEIDKTEGLSLGEMNLKLLEKVEELTLYMIQLKKQNEDLQAQINGIKLK
jgi:hypothetical protein